MPTLTAPNKPVGVPVAFHDYDPVCLYRRPEEDAARAALARAEIECRERLAEARAACSEVVTSVTADRMRLRRDCPKFDAAFFASVFGPSPDSLFGGDGHE